MKKIAIYSEKKGATLDNTAYELISKANDLKMFAKKLNNTDIEITNIVIANSIDDNSVKNSYSAGADRFILIKSDRFTRFNQIKFANAFLNYFKDNFYDFILFPATYTGRMIAPRITTALNTGLVADCTGIDFILKNHELKLASTRPTFGAELMATILSKSSPECATVRPKTFCAKFTSKDKGEFEEYIYLDSDKNNAILFDSTRELSKKHSFDNSKIIFCAGYGIYDGRENTYIEKLREIAQKTGADFALSRKLVDLGVGGSEYQIGQTGSTVSPEIYIGFGVSGAIQHVQGMKNSKTIVAVNSDCEAEIFKYCDYKIVKDAKVVIDELYCELCN